MFDEVVFPQASILLEQAHVEKREAYKREHIITRRRIYNTYSLYNVVLDFFSWHSTWRAWA